jgi:hypothetical protein
MMELLSLPILFQTSYQAIIIVLLLCCICWGPAELSALHDLARVVVLGNVQFTTVIKTMYYGKVVMKWRNHQCSIPTRYLLFKYIMLSTNAQKLTQLLWMVRCYAVNGLTNSQSMCYLYCPWKKDERCMWLLYETVLKVNQSTSITTFVSIDKRFMVFHYFHSLSPRQCRNLHQCSVVSGTFSPIANMGCYSVAISLTWCMVVIQLVAMEYILNGWSRSKNCL